MQETPKIPEAAAAARPVVSPALRLQSGPAARPHRDMRFMQKRRPSAIRLGSSPVLLALGALALVLVALMAAGYYMAGKPPALALAEATSGQDPVGGAYSKAALQEGTLTPKAARARLLSYAPKGVHIIVDTAANRLYLKKGDKLVLEAVVSSGSGNVLRDPSGDRQWVFDTPRGEYSVSSKLTDPDWIKPDWAFIEEGQDAPKNWGDRVESGVLGDYALGFGKGYFIHGTLYTRLLGRNVTHGCIRAADKDLKEIFKYAEIGTRIFIY